jgi:hypothetical protein
MVETAIKNAKTYPTKKELLQSLPKPIPSQTLDDILARLQDANKIAYDGKRMMWTFADNPKLRKLAKTSIKAR